MEFHIYKIIFRSEALLTYNINKQVINQKYAFIWCNYYLFLFQAIQLFLCFLYFSCSIVVWFDFPSRIPVFEVLDYRKTIIIDRARPTYLTMPNDVIIIFFMNIIRIYRYISIYNLQFKNNITYKETNMSYKY